MQILKSVFIPRALSGWNPSLGTFQEFDNFFMVNWERAIATEAFKVEERAQKWQWADLEKDRTHPWNLSEEKFTSGAELYERWW